MKYLSCFVIVLLAAFASGCVPPEQQQPPPEQPPVVTTQVFYDELSPYGHWVQHGTYGYVWCPIVQADFVPYSSNGHWEWTEYGWTWVSDFQWGWAPFHYGRWDYDDELGWVWIPDTVWGPAWVVWNQCPGYYGWAPMGPGITIDIWNRGRYHPPERWWTYCDEKYLGNPHMRDHYVPREQVGRIIGESRAINNTMNDHNGRPSFVGGPRREDVQRATGAPVRQVTVKEGGEPSESMHGQQWKTYKPPVQRSAPQQPNPAPRAVEKPTEFKPSTRGQQMQQQPATHQMPVQRQSAPPRQQAPPARESGGGRQGQRPR